MALSVCRFPWPLLLALSVVLSSTVCISSAVPHDPYNQRVLIRYRAGARNLLRKVIQSVSNSTIFQEFDFIDSLVARLPNAAVKFLKASPFVELVEPDALRFPQAEAITYGAQQIQAPLLWQKNITGRGAKICVVDSGLHSTHEDFDSSAISGFSWPQYATGSWQRDLCGHGTHVAGTIAAQLNNGVGVAGVSPDVSLFVVKVFRDDCQWDYASSLIQAVQECEKAGAKIISMSLGGPGLSLTEKNYFDSLSSKGFLSVAAAGNDGNSEYSYPASYDSVISVGAVSSSESVASFSQTNNQVELAAPGVSVLSTAVALLSTGLEISGVKFDSINMEYTAETTVSGPLASGALCASFPSNSMTGKVVLCERGLYTFKAKAEAALAAGAVGVVVYNNEAGNFYGTLMSSISIPVVSISKSDGELILNNYIGALASLSTESVLSDTSYASYSGTSMATPHVSAAIALLWSAFPQATSSEIRTSLRETAKDKGTAGKDNAYGYGIIQVKDAFDYLQTNLFSTSSPTNSPSSGPSSSPTSTPSSSPSISPSTSPSSSPSNFPTFSPSRSPSTSPSISPSSSPSASPTHQPSQSPIASPTISAVRLFAIRTQKYGIFGRIRILWMTDKVSTSEICIAESGHTCQWRRSYRFDESTQHQIIFKTRVNSSYVYYLRSVSTLLGSEGTVGPFTLDS